DRLLVSEALRLGRLQRVLPDWQLPGSTAWAEFPERRLMPLRTRVFLEAMSALLESCPTPAARSSLVGLEADLDSRLAGLGNRRKAPLLHR
ncbi:hypothetical protein ABTK16_19510, partial [Acinetobacter baumannii]